MGSDDLHHKRKKAANRPFVRSKNRRASYDVVLIVCEGKKTEPYYLEELREELQLNSANVKVVGRGTDPLSLVNYALNEFDNNKDYDQIYCVFDKDQHTNYQDALYKITSCRTRKTNKIPIHAITSVPCFEYWLLLHFVDTASPYVKTNKSVGDQVLSQIKEHIRDYKKGQKNIFSLTKDKLETAISRARKIDDQQRGNKTDNPSTKIYDLVEYLKNVKKK